MLQLLFLRELLHGQLALAELPLNLDQFLVDFLAYRFLAFCLVPHFVQFLLVNLQVLESTDCFVNVAVDEPRVNCESLLNSFTRQVGHDCLWSWHHGRSSRDLGEATTGSLVGRVDRFL